MRNNDESISAFFAGAILIAMIIVALIIGYNCAVIAGCEKALRAMGEKYPVGMCS